MSDIFLSYGSDDRAIAQRFSSVLEALGWSVWWDREIPHGKDFDLVIEQELNAARCAIVLWSKESVQSRWVRGEASAAAARDCLIPVLIEPVTLPLEFRQIQTADLIGWNGDTNNPEFVRLLEALTGLVGREPNPTQTSPTQTTPTQNRPTQTTPTQNRPSQTSPTQTTPTQNRPSQTRPTQSSPNHSSPPRVPAPASRRRLVTSAIAGAAIVAIVVAFALRNERTVTDERPQMPSTSIPATSAPSTSVSPASVATEAHSPLASANAIPVAIGDKIQEGAAGPGAGVIETAHEKDTYSFTAQRGQSVFFQVLSYSTALATIEWRLIDANEMEVFRSCLGCGQPGVQNLRAGGRYTLIVGSDREAGTGTYRLQLHDVPAPDRFKIAIGDVVGEDATGPGSGVIESPGVEDVYTFEAVPRQRVYFRVREHSTGIAQARVRLLDSNETPIFEGCLGCGEPGVQALTKGGSYSLIVGIRNDPGTGTYRLQLFDVPKPDEFALNIPTKIANGIPGRGAGLIESPGAEDRYTLHVDANQKLEFKVSEYDKTLTFNLWRLIAADGTELFNRCFGCSQTELQTFSRAGRYLLIVGNAREASGGAYAIEIVAK
jgi:hypothetical protein